MSRGRRKSPSATEPAHVSGAVPGPRDVALATDLYELTMAAGYFLAGKTEPAAFELFVRALPPNRGYLLACGLEQALRAVLAFRFTDDQVAFLRGVAPLDRVPDAFFEALLGLRFEGDVWAVPEGTVVFGNEPLLRVRAPILQAQLLETVLLSLVSFQTMVATKAARVVAAAQGRPVVDFGSRRAHGPGAGVLAARAAYVGGCAGTSNLLAGRLFGIPVYGTAAHSWTMAFEREEEAFAAFRRTFPDAVLLVDTYDPLVGARRAAASGPGLRGVRLDSGDLVSLSKKVRRILRRSGQTQARIFASGDLDEWKISRLLHDGADLDAFGVGTHLVTSFDHPALNAVYKLVQIGARPVVKTSEGKQTYAGCKQVFRQRDAAGRFAKDVLALHDEPAGGEPLLEQWMEGGRLIRSLPMVAEIRSRAEQQLAALPGPVRRLRRPARYPVEPSPALQRLTRQVAARSRARSAGG